MGRWRTKIKKNIHLPAYSLQTLEKSYAENNQVPFHERKIYGVRMEAGEGGKL